MSAKVSPWVPASAALTALAKFKVVAQDVVGPSPFDSATVPSPDTTSSNGGIEDTPPVSANVPKWQTLLKLFPVSLDAALLECDRAVRSPGGGNSNLLPITDGYVEYLCRILPLSKSKVKQNLSRIDKKAKTAAAAAVERTSLVQLRAAVRERCEFVKWEAKMADFRSRSAAIAAELKTKQVETEAMAAQAAAVAMVTGPEDNVAAAAAVEAAEAAKAAKEAKLPKAPQFPWALQSSHAAGNGPNGGEKKENDARNAQSNALALLLLAAADANDERIKVRTNISSPSRFPPYCCRSSLM